MKKIQYCFLSILVILIFSSCSNSQKNISWKKINQENIFLNIEPGDIIVKEKTFSILGFLGHSAIMKYKKTIVDYPKFLESSYEIDIESWLEENRDILILRYKDMNETFRKKLIENINKYSNKKYKIVFNRENDDGFYCSQFIWFVYYKTAQDLGFYLDLDSDKGLLIFPYDFINSEDLKIIN